MSCLMCVQGHLWVCSPYTVFKDCRVLRGYLKFLLFYKELPEYQEEHVAIDSSQSQWVWGTIHVSRGSEKTPCQHTRENACPFVLNKFREFLSFRLLQLISKPLAPLHMALWCSNETLSSAMVSVSLVISVYRNPPYWESGISEEWQSV